jgi:hypothetical protein
MRRGLSSFSTGEREAMWRQHQLPLLWGQQGQSLRQKEVMTGETPRGMGGM